MAIDLKDIKKMSPKVRLLIVGLIFFIVGYFYWFFFLISALAAKSDLTEKLSVMEQKSQKKQKLPIRLINIRLMLRPCRIIIK